MMKKFFENIDSQVLKESIIDVIFLTFWAFLPVIITFFINYLSTGYFWDSVKMSILPTELLTYSLSFLVPTMHLILVKNHGKNYNLPYIYVVSSVGILIYTLNSIIYFSNRNGWLSFTNPNNVYWSYLFISLFIILIFRFYSTYHSKNSSNKFHEIREKSQDSFNNKFTQKVLNKNS